MNSRALALIVLTVVVGSGWTGTAGLPEGLVTSKRNQVVALKYLRSTLMSRGGAGRIEYSTICAANDGTPLPFPQVEVVPPSAGKSGLAAAREIFKSNKNVAVAEGGSGIIRVRIGEPELAILKTRIQSLTFKQDERYNPELAIFAILNAPEVQDAMRKLRYDQPLTVLGMGITVPEEGVPLPHLPASIKDQTMDQALDTIAHTFKGIVIYKTCAKNEGTGLVSLEFVQVVDF